jgi:hypothetical protein
MIRRLAIGTAAGTSLMLTLTGCLGGGGTSAGSGSGNGGNAAVLTASAAIEKTSQKTSNVDTMKIDASVSGQLAATPVTMHMTGQLRLHPKLAMAMNIDQLQSKGQTVPGGIQEILLGDTIYMKMPALSQMTGGKPWIKISLKEVGSKAGISIDQLLQQAEQQNPADQTKLFTASKDVKQVGTETIDGVKTTHYTGTVSPSEMAGKLDSKLQAQFEGLYKQLGVSSTAFDVWVDGDSLPRKMVTKMTTKSGTMSTTILYRDYGKPVSISAPPASLTGSLPSNLPNVGGA